MNPTAEQLDHLIGHTSGRALSPEEHALLRAGVQALRDFAARLAIGYGRLSTTTHHGAPTSAYHQQVVQQLRAAEDELAQWRQKVFAEGMLRRRAETAERRLRHARRAWQSTIIEARRQAARTEQAEARIAALTPCIDRILEAAGRMAEHWSGATSTGNTEWRNGMWAELHRSADALAATLAGEPVPMSVPDGACGAYTPRHGAVCTRPKGHTEAYHRDARERVYWLAEATP